MQYLLCRTKKMRYKNDYVNILRTFKNISDYENVIELMG